MAKVLGMTRHMMTSLRGAAGIVGAMLVLAGCAGGTDEKPLQLELFRKTKEAIQQNRAQKNKVPLQVTRAMIDQERDSLMEIVIEQRDVTGYVFARAQRRDALPGTVVIWRTGDNISLALRNGVVIATRGLGGDVLSSSVQVSGTQPGPSHGGEHIQMVRALDDREVAYAFGCDVVDLGSDPIEIYDHHHPTRHIRQSCEGRKGDITNDYWIAGGKVWQSRQWAGPTIGYIRYRRLND